MAVVYERKSPIEHILLRPDTYIGSIEKVTQSMWVINKGVFINKNIEFVPGLYKIFDEIVVNAADHRQRDRTMTDIHIFIDPKKKLVSVYNNGSGIDTSINKKEGMPNPTLIFGHLLTGANFDDGIKKVVGGRNGYGAKLCNIFSVQFTVETLSKGVLFKQTWRNNMSIEEPPELSRPNDVKQEFTRVTFVPDLAKFGMRTLDDDIVALMSRRAYDLAATSGVSVYLNSRKVPINSFTRYINMFIPEDMNRVSEHSSDRWQVAVAKSESGFQQVSFVNNIATYKGGRHVDHVVGIIIDNLQKSLQKKKMVLKPFQIKNHLWVFVNCLIENPAFDSQTKENMNTPVARFGSSFEPSKKFIASVEKNTGIMDSVIQWVRFKEQEVLEKTGSKTKQQRVKGFSKLEDANNAGTRKSLQCTLILTEGDSAKSLVVAGLSVIGRDNYGVFPLKGKLLNVRDASYTQISNNAELTAIVKILGLQYKKNYESQKDIATLRYGKLMIMTDQDQDGSHIKGLVINFLHVNWPSLIRGSFLEEFITPIIRVVVDRGIRSFYSIPEYQEWLHEDPEPRSRLKPKYYKGLGTSTSNEAKEYFSDLGRHRVLFRYRGPEDDDAIELAFSKKKVEDRKKWLLRFMGAPDREKIYLYKKNTKEVSYKEFVDKELVLFSNMDNERSIPSLVDGLKPGQRKVMFTCFLRNDRSGVRVTQLAGSVSERAAYHHGEAALIQTIIGLAQDFVGSNNINMLSPIGLFGTRQHGGKDYSSARYICTMLTKEAELMFPEEDRPVLEYLVDENVSIEPKFYVPVIPLVLVNGAEGIGTGWSTKIPNYNPRDIIANIRRMMASKPPIVMKPWFRGFKGSIEPIEGDRSKFVVSGISKVVRSEKTGELDLEIVELPVRVWTQTYKEQVIEPLRESGALPNDYNENHTINDVRFVLLGCGATEKVNPLPLKLQTTFSTNSMVLFDAAGKIKRYESPEAILKEFYIVRLEYYKKRKEYWAEKMRAEMLKLQNQARFIQEKVDGVLKPENTRKNVFQNVLNKAGYDSDPVRSWKEGRTDTPDYDYLIDMPIRNILLEKKEELLQRRDTAIAKLRDLESSSPEDLWERDLERLEAGLKESIFIN